MPRSLMMSRSHAARTGALLAGAVLLTACSSTQDGTATAAGSTSASAPAATPTESTGASVPTNTSTSAAAPSTPAAPSGAAAGAPADLPDLALTASDFPPPFVYQPVNPKDIAGAAGGALGAGATSDPPACSAGTSTTAGADLAGAGLAVAIDQASGVILAETVAKGGQSISTLPDLAKQCASFTINTPQAGAVKGTIVLLDKPAAAADATAALKVTGTASAGGQTSTIELITYIAELRGVQVTVGATSINGSSIDLALLQGLLDKGVAKVRAG